MGAIYIPGDDDSLERDMDDIELRLGDYLFWVFTTFLPCLIAWPFRKIMGR